jgi:ATP synthase protein I
MPLDRKPGTPKSEKPALQKAQTVSQQFALAMELPFVLVGAIFVGGLFGYFLDRWLHTKPIFMLVLGALGFFAGVRDVLRRVSGSGDGTKDS